MAEERKLENKILFLIIVILLLGLLFSKTGQGIVNNILGKGTDAQKEADLKQSLQDAKKQAEDKTKWGDYPETSNPTA
jgi:hypothetical protein